VGVCCYLRLACSVCRHFCFEPCSFFPLPLSQIPRSLDEAALHELFGQIGPIHELVIIRNRATGAHRGRLAGASGDVARPKRQTTKWCAHFGLVGAACMDVCVYCCMYGWLWLWLWMCECLGVRCTHTQAVRSSRTRPERRPKRPLSSSTTKWRCHLCVHRHTDTQTHMRAARARMHLISLLYYCQD